MKLALDSNIFIAYLQDDDAFFEPAERVLEDVVSGKHNAVFSALTFGEVMYGAASGGSMDTVELFFNELTNAQPVAATKEICLLAATLRLKYPSLKLPDAIHLATALNCEADKFLTADRRLYTIASKELKSELLKPRLNR